VLFDALIGGAISTILRIDGGIGFDQASTTFII
jgi:hypothetical protein